jgi:CheY-like chemotaxis protein
MAGGIAHDFNNVLGVILGYVELAKMGLQGADPKVLRHLETALSTLGRARQLADRLLDFVREEPRPDDAGDLNLVVQEVRELLAETLDRRIEFLVNLDPELPLAPLGPEGLRQLVTNLCLNAASAMPGGGRLTLATARETLGPEGGVRPGTYAVLRVSDTGSGVPRELRRRVFDPWFTTRPQERSGLGLWVARGLAERNGGRIEAGGDQRGAVFTVWLPHELRVPQAGEEPAACVTRDEAVADVLIVDDEPGVREVTRAFLEYEGYRVLEAGSGGEAVRLLRETPGGVRVVFLDHVLPDARGAELAHRIGEMEAPPQVVLVTGLAGAPGVRDLPEGTRVLAKPYLHDDVIRLLRDALGIAPG